MPNLMTTQPQLDETLALTDVELQTPTLITEQEVRFSTAVALAPSTRQPAHRNRVVTAMRRMFAAPAEKPRQERRHQPRRYAFLENALMGREMDRL
ncbi:hypothetical protein A9W99_00765 [Mycobacterium sp. 1164966.3]|uniref:hypothetical protein n=1 Tax=Mycobacterium sp. 1164966.3 TaxID=1856861 RepID=UPI0008009F0E|nr:hypothetical protein [Mycobacterium sp. 1164966.3]OBA84436.1 hypothetical protein A9W99_00765 [Mycobacterium sp. 1164966.3]